MPTTLRELNTLSLPEAVKIYTEEYGFKLTAIEEASKKAFNTGWNLPSYDCDLSQWKKNPKLNIGLLLSKSNICTVDVDSLEDYQIVLENIKDLLPICSSFFAESKTARISSGKPNSEKLVFRVPKNAKIDYHKLVWQTINKEGRKENKTIFELRCGNKQDIAPPSIHPQIDPTTNTNYIYQWIGDEILEIPPDLLFLWQNWDKFEDFLKELNPNKPVKAEKTIKGKRTEWKSDDYLAQWKHNQSLPEMLERYGYKKVGNRYISPNSHSGSAGIVLSDGDTFFSFNESDPLADGHQHDALDLLAVYEFDGDKSQAYKYVLDELFSNVNNESWQKYLESQKDKEESEKPHSEKKEDKVPDVDISSVIREEISDWLNRETETVDFDGYPVFKNSPMYDLCLDFVQHAHRPRAVTAIMSALMFGSTICSRGYFFSGSQSKLYGILTGSSGSGKNDCIKAIERWAEDIQCPDIVMRVSKFSADSSVQRAIIMQPKSIVILDEYGKVLSKSKNDVISSSANTHLTIQYTSDTFLYPSGYSDDNKKESKNSNFVAKMEVCKVPALSLLGLGVPLDLESALVEENFETGEFSRYVMAFLKDAVSLPHIEDDAKLSDRCIVRIWQILSSMGEITPMSLTCDSESFKLANPNMKFKGVALMPYDNPPKKINCYLEKGELSLEALDEDYQVNRLQTKDIIKKTLFSRRLEKIQRVSIILQLLNTPYDVEFDMESIAENGLIITQKNFADAIKFVEKSDNDMLLFEKSKKSYNSQILQYAETIYTILKNGKDFTKLSRKEINQIFDKKGLGKIHPSLWVNGLETCLEEVYGVEVVVNPVKRGRPLNYYQIA